MTLYEDVHGPKLGWWQAKFVGGPWDGREAPLSGPYPTVQGYRRQTKLGPKSTPLTYVWPGDDD